MSTLLALAIASSLACAAPPKQVRKQTSAQAYADRLRAQLETNSGGPKANSRLRKSVLKTTTAEAYLENGPPGADRLTVVVYEGRSYGKHGDFDLAQLIRRQRWSQSPPSAEDALAVISAALFDGLLAPAPSKRPSLSVRGTTTDYTLTFSVVRSEFPTERLEKVEVTIGPSGKATIRTSRVEAQTTKNSLQAALIQDDAMAIRSALQALHPPHSAQTLSDVAKASALANDSLAAVAIQIIGRSTESARALSLAWSSLDEKARTLRLQLAEAFHGKEFRHQIERPAE